MNPRTARYQSTGAPFLIVFKKIKIFFNLFLEVQKLRKILKNNFKYYFEFFKCSNSQNKKNDICRALAKYAPKLPIGRLKNIFKNLE